MAFTFLHAADLHLDTPFAGLSATSPDVGAALREASLEAFEALVRLAIARDVSLVILAGDIYDGAERGVRAQLALYQGVSRLAERGIHTVMVAGNHDPVDEGWSAIREWPDLVTVFPSGAPTSVTIERDGQPLAVVHGTSYGRRAVTENLALSFKRDDRPGIHIAVLHANVGGQPGHDPYSPCTVDDLVGIGMDYWALGHVHTRQVLHQAPWMVYPGNTQGRSPRTSEQGAKGAVIVTVDAAKQIVEPEFVALDRVRFDKVLLDVSDLADVGELCESLVELGNSRLNAGDGRSLILRAKIVGRGALHGDLARPGAAAGLLAQLRDDAPSEVPFLWWDRLEVATTPAWDLDELQGRNDFVADLVDESSHLDPGEMAASWSEQLPADLAALLGVSWSADHAVKRRAEATELAIDLVAGHED